VRFLLAPDKFKGTFSASDVCRHLRAGILEAHPEAEVISHPLADGGEGTLDVLLTAMGGERIPVRSRGPLGADMIVEVGRLPDGIIVIESALICGLGRLQSEERNPMETSTYGVGLVVSEVLSWRPPAILVGLGGSATVDCGLGAARALGYRFISECGGELDGRGSDLGRLARIQRPAKASAPGPSVKVIALCDVRNSLVGPDGAAETFAAQKGASSDEIGRLVSGLERVAEVIESDLGIRVADVRGGGAAGGLGAGLHAFVGAELVEGASEVMRLTGLNTRKLTGVDLVVTGEGSYDRGSRAGKVVHEVSAFCQSLGIPIVVVCGQWDAGMLPSSLKVVHGQGVMSDVDLREIGSALALEAFDEIGG
jgi:glycerate kinase